VPAGDESRPVRVEHDSPGIEEDNLAALSNDVGLVARSDGRAVGVEEVVVMVRLGDRLAVRRDLE